MIVTKKTTKDPSAGAGPTRPGVLRYRVSARDGRLVLVTEIDTKTDALVSAWLILPEVAERLGVEVTRVRQLVKEGQLIAVRRGENRVLQVPADFIGEGKVVKGLAGTLTLLKDDGFTDEEMLEWLFTPDPTLPGTPAQALRENRGTEVKRRAQALAV
jgi:hypothetical protein